MNDTVIEYVVKNGIFTRAWALLERVRKVHEEEGFAESLSLCRTSKLFNDLDDKTIRQIITGQVPVFKTKQGFTVHIGV